MKFLTPAFVRVQNPAERKELYKWLCDIGYAGRPAGSYCFQIVSADSLFAYFEDHNMPDEIELRDQAIDCGTNVELFKALAAMNDSSDFMQWFTNGEGYWLLCRGIDLLKEDEVPSVIEEYKNFWRKATAKEIIEYFKPNTEKP